MTKVLPISIQATRRSARGMTLIELLIVIAIIAVLLSLLIPGMGRAMLLADAATSTAKLREVGLATISWSADNGGKLPSPEYPGGMEVPDNIKEEDFFPEYYNIGETGLWLDGVVFAALYLQENKDGEIAGYEFDENGTHLKGTVLESTVSVKNNPEERDYHKHSYAMNANLAYDRIYDQVTSEDPYLTEKTMSNLVFSPIALLYIDCSESNVIMSDDRQMVIDAIEDRWNGSKAIAAFLDGHAERITENQIPDGDPEVDRAASRFWRGVDPD